MPPASGAVPAGAVGWLLRQQGLAFPVAVISSILVIVVPLPPVVLDLLLSANLTLAVVILLTAMYVRTPLEFSVFPSVLLATTLLRLVLNVATTRLILTRAGQHGTSAAGGVIRSFGEFVAGDKVAVGLILFFILVVIQFVVITKGATRISEVAARFALDGMPGRQMAVDADLSAGAIDPAEARRRRQEIAAQADFYGAMDGASKFVRGDAIAGIVIVLANIVGGLYMGVVESGMDFRQAAEVFTKLTIGDGLVTQVPAFIISVSAGLIMTRTTAESNLGRDVVQQLFSRPEVLFVATGFLGLLSFTHLPRLPLVALGGACSGIAYLLTQGRRRAAQAELEQRKAAEVKKPAERPEDLLQVDPMELEIGYSLIRLADKSKGGDLADRVQRVRTQIAHELGIILPKVRIRDNIRLEPRAYQVKIKGAVVAKGTAHADHLLALDGGGARGGLEGIAAQEPASGRPATWIGRDERERAEQLGYTVVEPAAVLATHLTEVVKRHADELLTREQVKKLLDGLKASSPALVEEVVPAIVKPGEVQKVLQNLLRERVPIRDLETILEALGDYGSQTKDTGLLTEYVRQHLARLISNQYRDASGVLHVVMLDPALEDTIAGEVEYGERGLANKLEPRTIEEIGRALADEVQKLAAQGRPAVVLCSPEIRPAVKQMMSAGIPNLVVMSYDEVTRDTQVESVGLVSYEGAGRLTLAAV